MSRARRARRRDSGMVCARARAHSRTAAGPIWPPPAPRDRFAPFQLLRRRSGAEPSPYIFGMMILSSSRKYIFVEYSRMHLLGWKNLVIL